MHTDWMRLVEGDSPCAGRLSSRCRIRKAFLIVGIPCLLLAMPLPCEAQGLAIPEGFGQQLTPLLDATNPMLPSGWEWLSASIQKDHVLVTFGPKGSAEGCTEAPVCLKMVHAKSAGKDVAAASATLAISIERLADVQHRPLAGQLAEHIVRGLDTMDGGAHEQAPGGPGAGGGGASSGGAADAGSAPGGDAAGSGTVWVEVEEPPLASGLPAQLLWNRAVLAALLLTLLVLLGLEFRKIAWRWVLVATAGVAAVCAVGWMLVPWGVIHENHFGYRFLMAARGDLLPVHVVYSSVLVAMEWLYEAAGAGDAACPGDAAFFLANQFFLVLSAPLWGLWIARVSGAARAGVAGALIWALSPLALRMGPTDSLFNLACLCLPMGALLLGHGLELVSRRLWRCLPYIAAAILSAVVMSQASVMAIVLCPTLLLMGLALSPSPGRAGVAVLAAACGLVGLGLLPHVSGVLGVAGEGGSSLVSLGNVVTLDAWTQRLLVDTRWVSPTVLLLALAGLVAGWRSRRPGMRWASAAAVVTLLLSLPVAICRTYHVAAELPMIALFSMLAGYGAHGLGTVVVAGKPQLRWVPIGVGVLAVAGGWLAWPAARFAPPETAEYRLLRQQVFPALAAQPAPRVWVPDAVPAASLRTALPLEWLQLEVPGAAFSVAPGITASPAAGAVDAASTGPVVGDFVYVGLACQRPHDQACPGTAASASSSPVQHCQPLAAALQPHCRQLVESLRLQPVVQQTLATGPADFLCVGFADPEVTIGLYRVVDTDAGL